MATKSSTDNISDQERLNIFEALLNGDVSSVAESINRGCDVNIPGDDGLTPLCAAIRNGESEIACFLIPHAHIFRKAQPQDNSSMSSLLGALLSGDRRHRFTNNRLGNLLLNGIWGWLGFLAIQSILNILLKRLDALVLSVLHLDKFWMYSAFRTILLREHIASLAGIVVGYKSTQYEMPSQYDYGGTNLTVQGYIALENILQYGGNVENIMIEMLKAGLVFDNVNKINIGYALRVWEWAALKGHMRVMIALQGMGIDLDAEFGLALRIACYNLNAGLCKHLLLSGASVNLRRSDDDLVFMHYFRNNEGPAIVQCARGLAHSMSSHDISQAKANAFSIMNVLIDNGENINNTGLMGETTLSIVCSHSGFRELVAFLLNHGALPNIADKRGSTPLHKASYATEAPLLTKMLLEAGADPNVYDKNGRTPMNTTACDGDSVLNLQLLVNASNPAHLDWDNLLHQASRDGGPEMWEYLLSKGAKPTTKFDKMITLRASSRPDLN